MSINKNSTQPGAAFTGSELQLDNKEMPCIWSDPRSQIDRRKRVCSSKIPGNGCRRIYDRRIVIYKHTEQWWLQRDYDNLPLELSVKDPFVCGDVFEWLDRQKTL